MTKQEKKYLDAVSQIIFDKKGFNILALDVRQISTMTDYYIIAEGSVGRHVRSLCQAIKNKMQELGLSLFSIEGEKDGDWIVMDYYDIVIHLFTADVRERYALEELWNKASIVNVEIILPKEASHFSKGHVSQGHVSQSHISQGQNSYRQNLSP